MRLSTLLGKTLRQPPSEAHLPSHQLLVRAAYVRTLEGGLLAYLPLGQSTLERLQRLVRRALAAPGGQEIAVPSIPDVDPAEALVGLVRREVDSYRQLPLLLFQLATRPVPLARSRAGLFGASERLFAEIHAFAGPDVVGADIVGSDMAAAEQQVEASLAHILAACDLQVAWARAGEGDRKAFYAHPAGDEDLVRCPGCGYAAVRAWAATAWPDPPDEAEQSPEEIATPGCDTIAALAQYLDIPATRTLKMVFYSVKGKVTCLVIRGDRVVDEDKLARTLGTDQYYASLENELAAIGAVGGYASPIGLDQSRVRVVADPSVRSGRNFVSGANRPDYHIQNVNVPRDFVPGEWVNLALVEAGDPCPHCGSALEIESVFALAYSAAPAPCRPEAEYLDTEGQAHPLWMASWRLDLVRLLAAVVESHHDDYGIRWPAACAPLDVYLLALDLRREEVAAQAQALYDRLQAEGLAVLYDDRDASAGVKFNDADLIGLPLRLTISKRSVTEGLIEAKWRDADERLKLDDDGLAAELARLRE